MISVDCQKDSNWLKSAKQSFASSGYCLIEGVLSRDFLAETRTALYEAQSKILKEVGREKLERAGELGVLRLMFKYEPFFFKYLEIKEVLQLIDELLSPTAILHLQNGFVLPSVKQRVFQNVFHRDFPRLLNGSVCSINTFFAIDDFTVENGATRILPGTHQKPAPPGGFNETRAVDVVCSAGSVLLFDSTLVHAAGQNTSGKDRLAINQQYTHAYLKQQIDYPRALSAESIAKLPERTKTLLGLHARPPSSLQEYYVPEDQRTYRHGQG